MLIPIVEKNMWQPYSVLLLESTTMGFHRGEKRWEDNSVRFEVTDTVLTENRKRGVFSQTTQCHE